MRYIYHYQRIKKLKNYKNNLRNTSTFEMHNALMYRKVDQNILYYII